ncbi:hypothetical protein AEAC466_13630 [Asticcacaulis sp. AC466]|uniref:DUF1003 domain-containing protein n=1 Tax=Asticcacaulis sp. AC466 TaxID=1282362 RepID=UPI0003C3F0FB|nr:DUF1003 domain-containing protein [Asticcacaulis sp. AC466]ESQ83287.1 hypothetical protein AEAC466_13630 [Asticcacaulis sp. AC466]
MSKNFQLDALAERFFLKRKDALDINEQNVLTGINEGMPISRDAAEVADQQSTFGERLSDRVAAIGGSWTFIITFSVILVGWMVLNSDVLSRLGLAFDPYPYIFLNLMLSTVAAIQAPIIMMSQNRQSAKDRVAAELDFEVNLRAELEIMRLHEKIDDAIMNRLDQIMARLAAVPLPAAADTIPQASSVRTGRVAE